MDNKTENNDKILMLLYEISISDNIEKPYKEFIKLSNEIPNFDNIIENLRADGLVLYQHLPNGLEQNLASPLTTKGIEYCKSKLN